MSFSLDLLQEAGPAPTPSAASALAVAGAAQKDILNISSFGLPKLVKAWQILIKSIEELKYAPNEEQSGSMTIIKSDLEGYPEEPGPARAAAS